MRGGRFDGVVQFDIRNLGAAYDPLLNLRRQRVPSGQIVQILLNDDIAAAREGRILVADQDGLESLVVDGVLGAVHKAEQIAVIKIAESVNFVFDGNRVPERRHDLRCEFEAEIRPRGADVEEQIARRRNRVPRPGGDLAERMEFYRPRISEEPVPCCRSKAHHAGEPCRGIAEPNCT